MGKRTNPILSATGGVFLSPEDVGSAIHWRVSLTVREPDPTRKNEWERKGSVSTVSELRLSDCSRSIGWDIDPDVPGMALPKLDRAIAELKKVRAVVAKASRLRAQHEKRLGLEG